MFTFLPPESEFMKEFRNPCWKAQDLEGEEKLFCIPFFYIIGFTKCGEYASSGIAIVHHNLFSKILKFRNLANKDQMHLAKLLNLL